MEERLNKFQLFIDYLFVSFNFGIHYLLSFFI